MTSPQNPAATRPPLHDVAHLGYFELLTPDAERSLWFFTQVLGLTEVSREGNSVYLRTWDDYERHTLKLTAHDTSGIRRVGLRAESQAALDRRVAAIEASGFGIGWKDGDPGIGATYVFRDPDGHELELYWEAEWYEPPSDDLRPALKNQVHFASKSYDLVYAQDWTGSHGRLHHVAFATDTREDILRAADICLDRGVFIETGPHKHAIQQTYFLYVYEPGGNRIELCNPVARLLLAPDWRTITWTQAERAKGQAWGLKTIESFRRLLVFGPWTKATPLRKHAPQ